MNSAQFHNTLAMLVQTYGDLLLAEKLRGDAEKARAEKAENALSAALMSKAREEDRAEKAEARIAYWEADNAAKVPVVR